MENVEPTETYQEERRCCTMCDDRNRCHICKIPTRWCCSDCRIDLSAKVYVCENTKCRSAHGLKCVSKALASQRDKFEKRIQELEKAGDDLVDAFNTLKIKNRQQEAEEIKLYHDSKAVAHGCICMQLKDPTGSE